MAEMPEPKKQLIQLHHTVVNIVDGVTLDLGAEDYHMPEGKKEVGKVVIFDDPEGYVNLDLLGEKLAAQGYPFEAQKNAIVLTLPVPESDRDVRQYLGDFYDNVMQAIQENRRSLITPKGRPDISKDGK